MGSFSQSPFSLSKETLCFLPCSGFLPLAGGLRFALESRGPRPSLRGLFCTNRHRLEKRLPVPSPSCGRSSSVGGMPYYAKVPGWAWQPYPSARLRSAPPPLPR
ncbi:hypothetical protein ANANG_G00265380 [Anguilla anguilla]|uniref:Uncharacterized protein n=1 Tax=Anguilla anguilla TaxID=7936 RepID=A0A9D3LQ27_ANGAN|nr:hypothetical protein ANANG_G00265380 [Anguilla anguilla]